jgi:hypothetical protein
VLVRVFKVMTLVDHDWTPVNEFDRQLGLIKNLERHNGEPGDWRGGESREKGENV